VGTCPGLAPGIVGEGGEAIALLENAQAGAGCFGDDDRKAIALRAQGHEKRLDTELGVVGLAIDKQQVASTAVHGEVDVHPKVYLGIGLVVVIGQDLLVFAVRHAQESERR